MQVNGEITVGHILTAVSMIVAAVLFVAKVGSLKGAVCSLEKSVSRLTEKLDSFGETQTDHEVRLSVLESKRHRTR